jgi:pilus assembly protein Flp/PilA
MIEYLKSWLRLRSDNRALSAMEYAAIAGLLAAVVFVAATTLGNGLGTGFTMISHRL